MIILIGEILATPETRDDIIMLGQILSARARTEPGCIQHELHASTENPLRLVFIERWRDEAALRRHFTVPETRAFARTASKMAAEPPTLNIYHAKAMPV